MKLFLVKYKKEIPYEGFEATIYLVAAENGYAAIKLVSDEDKIETGNLNYEYVDFDVPKVKEPKIIKSYDI
jgi:hypothetical protein